jgi:pimeloyl-ACP methyl ester carboxylesterase
MIKQCTFLLSLALVAGLTSCTSPVWQPDERSGLGRTIYHPKNLSDKNSFERTLSLPVNPKDSAGNKFDLYYFVRMPTKGKAAKTVLFVPGGPGQFTPGPFALVTFADFLIDNGYNAVFYHARGAGFSQIPPSNSYDRFLKASYVLEDIEAIRLDLVRQDLLRKDGKWDAVIGYSYGTVVAQQYAGTYKNNLERLILIGVQSRHGFQGSSDAFDQIATEIRDINRYTLERIYQRQNFKDLTPKQKSDIIDTAFGTNEKKGIFQLAEEKFGTVGFVASAYCDLKDQNELGELGKYSQQFFRALRGLRDVGWLPTSDVTTIVPTPEFQVRYGTQIKNGIMGGGPSVPDCGPDMTGSSDRVFNVVSIYDGINMSFLKKWLDNGKTKLRDAVRFSGGEAHFARPINKYLNKIGIDDGEIIEPWDPSRYKHDKPTLILKGSADTVSVGRAAEHIFLNALVGARTLVEYPGIGHGYNLPLIPPGSQTTIPGNLAVCVPYKPDRDDPSKPDPDDPDNRKSRIRDCLIYSFLEMNSATFNNPNDNKILSVIMKDKSSICYWDQNMAQARAVAGSCP